MPFPLMMEKETKPKNYPRKIARIVLKSVLFIFLFIVFVFLILLTPPAQRFLTGKVEGYLQKKLQTRVEIGSISFGLSGNINLQNVYIEDKTKDTLVSGGTIKAHLNYLRLFSNEVQIKDLELQNITAKVKRVLPDTVYNFQFIVDAFVTEQTKTDTTETAPLKLNISDIALDNINVKYTDVITGNDVFAHIGVFSATIDTLDPYTQHFDIPTIIARNVTARIKQIKPLVEPKPLAVDIAEASKPSPMKFNLGTIDLSKINIDYANDVSAFYTTLNFGQLKGIEKLIDLQNNRIYFDQVALNNSKIAIRFGRKPEAQVVKKQVAQEVQAQKQAGWDFKIANLNLEKNKLQFDDDNKPKLNYGLDYGHINAENLSLSIDNFVMNDDSTAARINKGTVREKSGLELEALQGDILYASNQTYLRNIYIKTPGSEIQRSAEMRYASFDALTKEFEKTVFNLNITNTRLQVKDILLFAPQLRNNPALSNPNDVWYVNIVGNGTLNQLNFQRLQFSGLRNTQLDANGTLSGLMNPKEAGGNFRINRFHTTQTDLALFTGQRLSNAQVNLPEEFDINGTISGNAGRLHTNLNLNSSAGFVGVNGSFSDLMNPKATTYNATIRTSGLRLGSILRQEGTIGSVSGNFLLNGRGLTPDAINTKFTGTISSLGYNHYQYRNIRASGSLRGTAFNIKTDINDPNIDLDLAVVGNFSDNPSFKINGMVDSIKLQPLHFTPDPMIFRGRIDGAVANLKADNPDIDLLITKALFVSNEDRLPLDTVQLTSGRNDTANYIQLKSDIANAMLVGQYRLTELGSIIQNTIQPYFAVTPPAKTPQVQPYNFRFTADVVYTPILSQFVPGLTTMETIHANGSFATGQGMNAILTTPYILYNGNEMHNLNVRAFTSEKGLQVNGTIARLKSGSSLDVYNARVNATALNNNIDFNLGIDDAASKNKYYLSGLITQPSTGTYAIKLKPDSLLLNYELWSVIPDNQIVISPTAITAHDFILQKDGQQLSISSIGGSNPPPLQVSFNNFRLATITGFVKADSTLVDGVMSGNLTFPNIMKQLVFTSDLTVANLSMRQDTLGDVRAQVNSSGSRYNTNITLTGRGNDVAITGSFAPVGNDIDLDLNLNVRALQLHTMEGAMASAITNASGAVRGNVKINGTSSKPDINGDLNFDHASFAISMLGGQFRVDNEKISVTNDGLTFNNFTIRDSTDNRLTIDGNVLTSNFINYNFNLRANANNFMVLNSTKQQNKLYYGKLNISTNLHITGTEIKPVVDGSLTVNDGTNLSIVVPQEDPGVVQRDGIVEFVDMDNPQNDSLFLASSDSLNKANVLGMDIAVNIEVKKEAILNVIVDPANGDFLNVRGEAVISAGIDPSGKITMVGNYSLEEGSYQISYNFIQRKFDIQKGSTITWTGEPTTAQLNVHAVYIANTAPIDLVEQQVEASKGAIRNTYLQKLPFQVHLNLTGELLKPVVAFDITLPSDRNYGVSNDIVTTVQSRLDQIRQDEGELNKQVFAVLLLGRFVGENPFKSEGAAFNAASYARQSVSNLLTEQLNQLAAGLIQGVDINFDVTSTDDYTTGSLQNRTDLNVGLSKRLLNDRLKISVGNNFQLQGPQNTRSQGTNIAGNIALDYQLSRDGRYMLRFYRRNQYEGIVDGYIIETGLSFILSADYNRLRQLLHKRKQRVTPNGTEEKKDTNQNTTSSK
ncbi:MAG TPA: translocation/assembly module TamB domain-containing protein [Flavisolibacter sp.]|nr:translocation/assembly module TamB domain-containing protein [Flavisolibacter sp.]